MLNRYVWNLYLESGGKRVVQMFRRNFSEELTTEYAEKISNMQIEYCFREELIEDTINNEGSSVAEIERAILFGYVVLDAEKYKLNILRAKEDLEIQELYDKYVLGMNYIKEETE